MYVNHLRCTFLSYLRPLPALNPRISYEGRVDYANDDALAEHLENSKSALFKYFHKNYVTKVTSSSGDTTPFSTSSSSHVASLASLSPPSTFGSIKKSFTARYCRKDKPAVNEREEYFKRPLEDFDMCDPI